MRALLLPRHHLGQTTSRAHEERLHGVLRDRVLRVEGRRRPRILWTQQRLRSLAGEKGEPAVNGPFNTETGRVGYPRNAVLVSAWGERAGFIRRKRVDAHRGRADGSEGVSDGTRPVVRGRDY